MASPWKCTLYPNKLKFAQPNGEIGQKMAKGQLIFQAQNNLMDIEF